MLFTSEQVSAGHPDKICDQISDAILDDCLEHDRDARVAAECMIKDYDITLGGEITSSHVPDFSLLARRVLIPLVGFEESRKYNVKANFSQQSGDIALGVDRKGAGDQGMMFGYATDETPELLPIPFVLATKALEVLRRKNLCFLGQDAKAQVTYDYGRKRIDTFLMSVQHAADADLKDVRAVVNGVMEETSSFYGWNLDFKALVNPTGRFVTGGSFADTGVTGRKIICDTYGGACRHGGGAFSGKDPTKLDRSGAYMARKIAKDVVRQGFAKRCEVQLAYAIGVPEPVSIAVKCGGAFHAPEKYIVKQIRKNYDLTPEGIIDTLSLRDIGYYDISTLGHFWRGWLPWER